MDWLPALNESWLLTLFTFVPALGALVILLWPGRRDETVKTLAAAASFATLAVGAVITWRYYQAGAPAGIHFAQQHAWIPQFNIEYFVGVDGFSVPMVLLSGLVSFVAVIASWNIGDTMHHYRRPANIKGYFALLLLLETGMNGVFVALDFFLFYVFWEVMLIPMYFLIGLWGGERRLYAAIKFFLYTMFGSLLMLLVILVLYYETPSFAVTDPDASFNYHRVQEDARATALHAFDVHVDSLVASGELARPDPAGQAEAVAAYRNRWEKPFVDEQVRIALAEPDALRARGTFNMLTFRHAAGYWLGRTVQIGDWNLSLAHVLFVLLFIGFAIKVPIFPFHTWLPWAHVEAPTAVSVILAGILLKMGVYGFLRVAYPMFPEAALYFAVPIGVLGVINILYGACCAMAQSDMKKLVAYSSVSHMGFCMLGLAGMTTMGVMGGAMQMFNHGVSTSMMFLLVGVIYDRAHHRQINGFGGLAARMPVYTGLMAVALFASMGLPGLSGFVSEAMTFLGTFQSGAHAAGGEGFGAGWAQMWGGAVSFQTLVVIAALGVIITAAYLLWMFQRIYFGPLNPRYEGITDCVGRELLALIPLVVLAVAFGVYPQPLITLFDDTTAVFVRIFEPALRGG